MSGVMCLRAWTLWSSAAGTEGGSAGMIEAGRQFRRVNGHMHLPKLRDALNACFTENAGIAWQDENFRAA